ncbi:hypothetical protein PanWU01x14_324820 [Parasponia andersonii]|uniref:Uncharacterized protein n=1 Tax=Parasponia andersonii TaxID=3476 RepID=A0A2P5AK10_PARAD|nr:hypothetical protein PanWU01x14_324820 [Parasponia andersonii]
MVKMIKHSPETIFPAIHGWNLCGLMLGEDLDSLWRCTVAGTPVLAARSCGFAHSASRLRGAIAAGDGRREVATRSSGPNSTPATAHRRCTAWDDEIEEEESSGT